MRVMLKIKEEVNLSKLEFLGFYLEGNTYKYNISKNKCVAICKINREIIRPELPVITNRIKTIFTSKKPYQELSKIMWQLDGLGFIEEN